MIQTLAIVLAVQLVANDHSEKVARQDEEPFLEWIDADSALVVTIDGLDSVVQFIEGLETADNSYLTAATDYIFHPEFPLVHPDRRELIGSRALELAGKLQALGKIVLVVHKFDPKATVELTILVELGEGKEKSAQDLGNAIVQLLSLFRNAGSPLPANGTVESAGMNEILSNHSIEFRTDFRKGWFLLSNSEDAMNLILERMQGVRTDFRVVAGNRRFQMIDQRLSRNAEFGPSIRVMGNPQHLRLLFPEISDHDWNANQVQELPGFGLQVALLKHRGNKIEKNSPMIVVEASVNFTLPLKGIAAVVAAHKPVNEIPRIGVVPEYVRVYGFDPQSLHDARRDRHDAVAGKPEYDTMQVEKYKDDPRDFMRDVLPRTDLICIVSYRGAPRANDEKSLARGMMLERVFERPASERYVAGLVEGINSATKEDKFKLVRIASEKRGELWAVNPQKTLPGVGRNDLFEPCLFLNEDWFATADINGLEPQINALAKESLPPDVEQFNSSLHARLDRLQRLVPAAKSPYDIEHSGNRTLHKQIDFIQTAYIGGAAQNARRKNRWVERSEPDEAGIYFRPGCKEDVAMIANLLLRKAIVQEIGDLLVIQSHSDSYWHGAAACFPAWEPDTSSAER
jgi:hypothetical protein